MDLQALLLDLGGKGDGEIEATGREWYERLYITRGNCGFHECHDGEEVVFWRDRFEHAFFTSSNWARYPDRKDKLAVDRIARIRWIGEVIAGNVPKSACWEVPSPTGRRRPPNRLYVVSNECYVVWLEPRMRGGWKFSSAYAPQPRRLREYCAGGRRIWVWKGGAP